MNDVLIVLNPRRIPEAIESIEALPVDKVWVRNLWLFEIEARWAEVEEAISRYEWAWIVSDDAVFPPEALEAVRELAQEGHPVVTGYANLDVTDPRVTLTRSPLGPTSCESAYDFYLRNEVLARVIETTFVAFCLTGMSVEMWKRYPFRTEPEGNAPDFNLSKRLAADGVPMVAHRDAFCWHLKPRWLEQAPFPLLIGSEAASIDVEVLV